MEKQRDDELLVEVESTKNEEIVTMPDGSKGVKITLSISPETIASLDKKQIDSLIAATVANSKKEKDEQEKGDKKIKFNRKALALIPIVLILPIVMHSCHQEPKTITETIPTSAIVYNIDNITEFQESVVNAAGQEKMTQAAHEGQSMFAGGPVYSSDDQFKAETDASQDVFKFEAMKQEVEAKMLILIDSSSTQDQIYGAAKRIKEISQQMHDMYTSNEQFMQEQISKFNEASEAYADSNTINEEAVLDVVMQDYLQQLGLTQNNIDQMQSIIDYIDQGYEVTIENAFQELDGDYIITGEAVREVAVEQETSKGVWAKFKEFITGRNRQEQTHEDVK